MAIDRRAFLAAAGVTGLAAVLAACGGSSGSEPAGTSTPSSPSSDDPALRPGPAEPGAAGAPSTPPAGRTFPVGDEPEGIVVGTSGAAMVGLRNPDRLAIVDLATGRTTQTVMTKGSPRHLELAGPDGPVIAPLEQTDTLLLAGFDGTVETTVVAVGRNPHDAARCADGTIVVADELGGGVIFVRDGRIVGELPPGPVQPGGVAAVGNYAEVSDVRGLGVFVYDATTMTEVASAKIGTQLTHSIALAAPGTPAGTGAQAGFTAVADTAGGKVEILRITPQVEQVATVETGGTPYGLGYDPARQLLLVTVTGDNRLDVVDVADPTAPRILGSLPTVQQPNSVFADPTTGDLVVAGEADGLLQVIPSSMVPSRA